MTYLAALGLPFATDASNTDLQYTRNRIRHRLLPLLEQEFSPQIRRHLAHLAKTFRTEEDWLEALTTVARERVQDTSETISLERLALEPFALRPRILRQWLEQTGQVHDVTFSQLKSLQDLSEGRAKGRVEVPGRFLVRRNRGHLLLERKGVLSGESSYCYLLSPGQELLITEGGWRVILSAPSVWSGLPHLARSSEPWQALFDADILPDRVVVRSFRQGDRICPLGMKGHKKVHDVFVDAKVPPRRRRSLPLVVIGAEVAWVPGCVRGELAKVTPVTRRVCRAEVSPLPGKYELC
jgi:tRNA(Ile)-lysidine synthase